MTRKIDELGRIVLPQTMREELEIKVGDKLDICIVPDGILLAKTTEDCMLCKSSEHLVRIGKYLICRSCINRLSAAKDGDKLLSDK